MSEAANSKQPSQAVRAYVIKELRDGIVTQKYKPGERLNETNLARQLDVSRIPVREALVHLQEHGLVMHHPRRGMFVSSLTEADIQKINGVRIVLEAEALKLCRARLTAGMADRLECLVTQMEQWNAGSEFELEAAELDLEFHRAFWNYSGNGYLEKTLNELTPVLFAHRALDGMTGEHLRWILNHHRALLHVIQGSSRDSPEEAMLAHLRTGYREPERYSSLAYRDGAGSAK